MDLVDMKIDPTNMEYFFSMSVDMLCIANTEGYFVKISPSFTTTLGYSEEDLLKSPFFNFIHPDDIASTAQEVEKLSRGETTIRFENRYRKKDGDYLWISWSARANPDTGYLYAVARDISKTKHDQELFAEAQAMANVGAWEVDVKDKTMFWTDEVYRIHDLNPGDKVDYENAIKFYHPEAVPKIQEALERSINEGLEYDIELRLITAKKRVIWVRAKGRCIFKGDTPVLLKGTFQDIDVRKRAEIQLLELNKALSSSNKELEEFAYIASHDLKEPLRKIISFNERIQLMDIDLPSKATLFMDRMNAAAGRMQKLIEDLLKYSRVSHIKSSENVLSPEAELRFMLNTDISLQEATDITHISPMPRIKGWESVHFRQLFYNLFSNSIKFKRLEEPLRIGIKLISENEKAITIGFSDNGIGFEQQYASQILKPFQRLHGRAEYEGTGIGLAICQKLMERHDGAIKIESIPNQGTTFYLTFKKDKRDKMV